MTRCRLGLPAGRCDSFASHMIASAAVASSAHETPANRHDDRFMSPCLASSSPHPKFSRMRAFVRAFLDKRRIGIVEDLAHLPGGVGGHVNLIVGAVVATGEADEFVGGRRSEVGGQRSEVRGRRSEVGGQRSEVRMMAEVARTSFPLPSWLIWRMGVMPATPRAAWTMAT